MSDDERGRYLRPVNGTHREYPSIEVEGEEKEFDFVYRVGMFIGMGAGVVILIAGILGCIWLAKQIW